MASALYLNNIMVTLNWCTYVFVEDHWPFDFLQYLNLLWWTVSARRYHQHCSKCIAMTLIVVRVRVFTRDMVFNATFNNISDTIVVDVVVITISTFFIFKYSILFKTKIYSRLMGSSLDSFAVVHQWFFNEYSVFLTQ